MTGEGFPGDSDGKESACNVGDLVSIPGLERSPGGGRATHSSILFLRIPMDRAAWWAAVHGVAKSQMRLKGLSTVSEEARFELRKISSLQSSAVKAEVPMDPPPAHPRASALLFLPWLYPTPGVSHGHVCTSHLLSLFCPHLLQQPWYAGALGCAHL